MDGKKLRLEKKPAGNTDNEKGQMGKQEDGTEKDGKAEKNVVHIGMIRDIPEGISRRIDSKNGE